MAQPPKKKLKANEFANVMEPKESKDYPGSAMNTTQTPTPPTTTTSTVPPTTGSPHVSNELGSDRSESVTHSLVPGPSADVIAPLVAAAASAAAQEDKGKPLTGSEEWHIQRRFNHKEVEKKRRKNIAQGINELQELLPTPDTNKAQIIKRAAEYIKRLKETETNNIEKWTLEKLISDQAVNELSNSNEKLKSELEKAYRDVEHWRKAYNTLLKSTKDE